MGFLWRKMKWIYWNERAGVRVPREHAPPTVRVDRTTHLRAGASHVRAKHDGPGSLVVELLTRGLEAVLEQLQVATTAVAALLVLDLILDDQGLVRELNGLGEGGGDGVVGSLGLGDKTLVAQDGRLGGFLDLPLANIAERLGTDRSLLGGLRGCPPLGPVVSELFEEGSLDGCRLADAYT